MTYRLIDDDRSLEDLCRVCAGSPWLALDTEFERSRTYYPRLCLIQVATAQTVACIDPLACDVQPLARLLFAPTLTKLLHSARQDLEVLYRHFGRVPAPLFDTQVAAAFCGLGEHIGYAPLVEALCGERLGKAHTRADWCRRPLGDAELDYAADDVRYLGPIHDRLRERLAVSSKADWVAQECAALTAAELYADDPALAYRRMSSGHALDGRRQQILKALCAWREEAAQRHDLPREWVLGDGVLLEVARRSPQTTAELEAFEALGERRRRRWGAALIAAVRHGAAQSPTPVWPRPARLDSAQRRLCDRLVARVRACATDLDIAPPLLATRTELRHLVQGARDLRVLSGWRGELIGEALLGLVDAATHGSG